MGGNGAMIHSEWINLLDKRKRLEYLIDCMVESEQKEINMKELGKLNKQVIAVINSRRIERKAPKFVECEWG